MKGMFFGAVLAVSFIALAGCATTEKSLRERGLSPLAQSELEALYSRTRTIGWTTFDGVRVTATYTYNGVAQLEGAGFTHQGSWRITGRKFCTQYQTIRNGAETCFTFYKTGENEYKNFYPDGSLGATGSFTN